MLSGVLSNACGFTLNLARSMIRNVHLSTGTHVHPYILGVLLTSIAIFLAACVDSPRHERIGPLDLVLSRNGIGNAWSDDQGNQFLEMRDQNGNPYFINSTGEVLCCYRHSQATDGLFVHLRGSEFAAPTTSDPVLTATPNPISEASNNIAMDPENHLEAGLEYIEASNYEQALTSLALAINMQQDLWQAYLAVGQAHFFTGNYREAVIALEQALVLDPSLDQAHYFHSLASLRLMSSRMALDVYMVDLFTDDSLVDGESNKSHVDLLIHPGVIGEVDDEDYREMLLHLNIVIGQVPGDPKLYTARSMINAVLKDYELAINDLDFAIRLSPGLAVAYLKRSLLHYSVDMLDAALSDYVTATSLDPSLSNEKLERMLIEGFTNSVLNSEAGDESSLLRRANGYRALQSTSLSLADYAAAIDINPVSAEAYLQRARLYLDLGRTEDAIADLAQSIKFDPLIPEAYSTRAEAFLILSRKAAFEAQSSDWEQLAIVDYAQAIQLDPTNTDLYLSRGAARVDAGRFELALSDYSRAINFDPEGSRAYFQRGKLYYSMAQQRARISNLERALEDYIDALVIDPDNVEYLIAKSRVHVGLGQEFMAIEDLFSALDISIDKAEVLLAIADTYHDMGKFESAVEYFTMLIDIDPQIDVLFHRRARSYLGSNNVDAALEDFSRASELSPEKLLYYVEPANLCIELGRHSDAIVYLTKAITLDAEDHQLYFLRANEYKILGYQGLAASDYAQASRLDPRNVEIMYRRSLSLLAVEDFETALNVTRAGLQSFPDDARLLVASGQANLGLGLYDAALAAYDKALLLPSSALTEVKSPVIAFEEPLRGYASSVLQDVLSERSDVYLGRARALMLSGELTDALQTLDQATKLAPHNPDLYWYRATSLVDAMCVATQESLVEEAELVVAQGGGIGLTVEFILPAELRSGPGAEYPLVASEGAGFTVDLTGKSESEDWYEVRYGPSGYGLWVQSSLVLVEGDVDSLPVLYEPVSYQPQSDDNAASDSECQLDLKTHQELTAALSDYTTAITLAPSARYHIDRAFIYDALGEHEQAIEDIAVAMKTDLSGFSRVQLERARTIQEAYLEYYGASASALGVYGTILTRMGEDVPALDAYSTAIGLDPEPEEWYVARGALYTRSGDLESAIGDYSSAIDLIPTDVTLKQLHADVLVKFAAELQSLPASKRESEVFYQLAIDELTDLIDNSSDNADHYVNRAHVYSSMGSYELALGDYSKALEIDNSVAHWYVKRALVWEALNEPNLAFIDYTHAITASPSDASLYFPRANLHATVGNNILALQDVTRAIALDKSEPRYLEARADFYSAANDPQAAMTDLTTAIDLSSGNVNLYAKRADAWYMLGQLRQSVADYSFVLGEVLDDPDYFLSRARAYIGLNEFDLALDDLEEAISINPGIHEYYGNRASVLMAIHASGEADGGDQSGDEGDKELTSVLLTPDEIVLPDVKGQSVGAMLEFTLSTNLRSGPGAEYPLVASEGVGFVADLTGISESGDWYEVRYGPAGYGLWVHNLGVLITGDIEKVPVVDDLFFAQTELSAGITEIETGTESTVGGSDLAVIFEYGDIPRQVVDDYSRAIELLSNSYTDQLPINETDATGDLLAFTKAEYHAGRAAAWEKIAEALLVAADLSDKPYFMVDELWQAKYDYDAAVTILEDNAQYLARRSEINLQLGLNEAALLDYLAAIELDPLVSKVLDPSEFTSGGFRVLLRGGD